MCLMFTLFYTQMRRVLVEREIKNLQTTFDQAVDDVNTELALHQSMSGLSGIRPDDCSDCKGRRQKQLRSIRAHGERV